MTRFFRPSQFLLFATIALAPWCIGGTRIDVQVVLALPILAALCLAFISMPERRSALSWPVLVLMAVAIPSCLQLVPLPISLVDTLSPQAAALYRQADPGIESAPLSVDVLSTAGAALHQTIFGAIVLLVVLYGRASSKTIAWIVVGNGVLMTALAMTHSLLGFDRVLGIYDSVHRDQVVGFVGPFVNPNTFASYLVLSTFTAMGLAISEEDSGRLRFALIAGLITLAGVLLTESRGGLLALGLGCFFFLMVSFSTSTEDRSGLGTRMRGVGAALGVAFGGAAVVAWQTQEDWQSLSHSSFFEDAKVRSWEVLGDWVGHYGVTGSGRGTFEFVYPQFQKESLQGTVTHAENIAVQMLAEYGLYVGSIVLLLGIAICIAGVRSFQRHQRGVLAGAIVAVISVFAQQGLDFGLESMGLSLSVAALLGCVFGDVGDRHPRKTAQVAIALPLVLGCLLLLVFGARCYATQGDEHFSALRTATTPDEIEQAAEVLARQHPADGLIPLTAAAKLSEIDGVPISQTLRWANRAQRLWPQNGGPHEVVGRALFQAGYTHQAAGEFRRAMEKSPWRTRPLLNVLSVQMNQASDLALATPENTEDQARLINALIRNGRPEMVLKVTDELLFFQEDAMHLHHGRARACLRIKDFQCVAQEVQFMDTHGYASLGRVFEARVAVAQSDFQRARELLEKSVDPKNEPGESVLRQSVRAYSDMGDYDAARECLNQLWLVSRLDSGKARDVLAQKARLEWRAGEYAQCRDAADRALTLLKSPDLTILAGRAEMKLGLFKAAEKRLWRAQKRWPKDTSIHAEFVRIKEQIKRGTDTESSSGE